MTQKPTAPFVTGSVWRHLVGLAVASSLGLFSTFAVDLLDIYYIGLLGDDRLTAAVGFGSTIAYYGISVGVALGITISVLVSRQLGRDDMAKVRDLFSSTWFFGLSLMICVSVLLILLAPLWVWLLQARGETADLATTYLQIIAVGVPGRALVMWGIFSMRLQGKVRLGLYATLSVTALNAILDPIFIFGFGWGIVGAALATAISTFVGGCVLFWWVAQRSGWLTIPRLQDIRRNLGDILRFYLPALLTNLSTPIGTGVVLAVMAARYDDSAEAATSVILKMTPLLFGFLLSLSGSVGPVVGQNFGAERYDRVRRALWRSIQIVTVYTLPVGLVVFVSQGFLVAAFGLSGEGAAVFRFFATYLVFTNGIAGFIFVSNAIFNNLGYPGVSTAANLLRDGVLMLPLTLLGALWLGAPGVLFGQQLATVLVAMAALSFAWALTGRLEQGKVMPKKIIRVPFVGRNRG